MGRSRGWMTSSCSGGRVAGKDNDLGLTYIPAHTVNGKLYNQRVTFTIYVNGSNGKSDRFQLVAYGPLADSICRSLSNGKAIDAILKPHSYKGRSFDANRVMRLEADGSPVLVEKVGFQIVEPPIYGEDSLKTIELEVATGRRPINWNVQTHPDNAIWIQMLKERSNVQYVPGSNIFGFAKVITPQGQGIVPVAQAATGPLAKAAAAAARAANTAQPAGGAYIPPVNTPPATNTVATGAATNPLAITPEQLALLVAQVTGQPPAGTGAQPTLAQGLDPKTGFAMATGDVGATETRAF